MSRTTLQLMALGSCVVAVALSAVSQMQAQSNTPYPSMAAGQFEAQVREGIAIFVKKELPALEPGAFTYMMSKAAYLTDAGDHNMAHLMFYTPIMDRAIVGSDLPKSPVSLNPQFALEGIDVFMVLTGMWSYGTLAPANS